jgi:hypothetical protein
VGRGQIPQPWWLCLPLCVLVFLGTGLAIDSLRERDAHRIAEVEQREFRRQELQTMQALVEEVRRLQTVLEAH